MHLEQRKMKEGLQIFDRMSGRSHRKVESLTVYKCMKFFVGWMKRFGYPKDNFFVPLEQKARPNL
jgi:hypothetical protein